MEVTVYFHEGYFTLIEVHVYFHEGKNLFP